MLVDKQSELISDLLFTVHQHGGDDVTWKPPICCMYLIDRFSQLIRCLVALHFKNTWDINDLTLKYYKKATSTTPLTLRTCHGCVYTGTFVLDNHALYLQHFMCIEYRNPMSSFSGTGWSTNSQCRWKGSLPFRTSYYFGGRKKRTILMSKTSKVRLTGRML